MSKTSSRRGFLGASAAAVSSLANPGLAAAQGAGVKPADLPDLTIKEVRVYNINTGRGAATQLTGIITDDMCANGDHKDMKATSDAKCVVDCVKGMNGKYVLYDSKAKKSYVLSDQKTPEKFAAKKVTVVGTLDDAGKNLKVDSI